MNIAYYEIHAIRIMVFFCTITKALVDQNTSVQLNLKQNNINLSIFCEVEGFEHMPIM